MAIISAPILYVGGVGVGKTAAVKRQYNNKVVVEILSGWLPEDILGLPVAPKGNAGVVKRLQPDWHDRITTLAATTKDRVCLFFDELDKARRDVADALLTLVQERAIGGWSLPDNVDIVAAANPPSCGGGDGIGDAMRTRFRVVTFIPDTATWCKWARETFAPHPQALAVIEAIQNGRLPLMDSHTGEAWHESRDANPRTWAFALAEIAQGNFSITGAEAILPSNIALLANKIAQGVQSHEEKRALNRSAAAQKKIKPVRF